MGTIAVVEDPTIVPGGTIMNKGEWRDLKRDRAVAKRRRKSNIKSLMVLIRALEARLARG